VPPASVEPELVATPSSATATAAAKAIPTNLSDKVLISTGVDVKAMAATGIKDAESSLVVRTNGVGYSCGFCVSSELLKADIICTLDDHNLPMVQVHLDHPKIPTMASIIDVPLGTHSVPVPFLSLPSTVLGLFGFVMTFNLQLLYEGYEDCANAGQTAEEAAAAARVGAGKVIKGVKSFNPFKKSESIIPEITAAEQIDKGTRATEEAAAQEETGSKRLKSISMSSDRKISDFTKIKISVGFNFRVEDNTGIISISIPELPIWVMDATVDADELKKAKDKAKGFGIKGINKIGK
jgi:hypothetical protein